AFVRGVPLAAIWLPTVYFQPDACGALPVVYACHNHVVGAIREEFRAADDGTSLRCDTQSVAARAEFVDCMATIDGINSGHGSVLCIVVCFLYAKRNPIAVTCI